MTISPGSISGLTLWLEADAIVGLNDGDDLTTWEDQSPDNNDAVQTDVADKPSYQTNELNSLPIVRFLSTRYLEVDSVAAQFSGIDHPKTFIILLKNGFVGANMNYFTLGKVGAPQFFKFGHASDLTYQSRSRDDTNNGRNHNAGTIDGNWNIATFRCDNASNIRVNGSDQGSDNVTAGTCTFDGARIASRVSSEGDYWEGDIAAILMYDSLLSDLEVQRLEWYLAEKYAISGPTDPGDPVTPNQFFGRRIG